MCAASGLTMAPTARLSLGAMTSQLSETLPPEMQLAIAHTEVPYRDALRIFFDFDIRLARILSGTSEPMLGQMRLAWWRETLAKPLDERPNGDVVLDAIGEHLEGREAALAKLVDGWEHLLAEPPLGEEHARLFGEGRVAAMRGVFGDEGVTWDEVGAGVPAWHWALADLARHVSLDEEREMLIRIGLEKPAVPRRLPSQFKGLAVLGALALRSLNKGGRPLMEGRGASITALRTAIFGR